VPFAHAAGVIMQRVRRESPISTLFPYTTLFRSWIYGPPKLSRYNGVSAMEILGQAAPGYSSGDAMAVVEELAQQLPEGVGISWRSEEHTSELQSRENLVCRRLLAKKSSVMGNNL